MSTAEKYFYFANIFPLENFFACCISMGKKHISVYLLDIWIARFKEVKMWGRMNKLFQNSFCLPQSLKPWGTNWWKCLFWVYVFQLVNKENALFLCIMCHFVLKKNTEWQFSTLESHTVSTLRAVFPVGLSTWCCVTIAQLPSLPSTSRRCRNSPWEHQIFISAWLIN